MAQKVLSFKKKARLTVMNMHSKLLNNHSVHLPLSAGGGWVEPPTKFSKKAGGLDRNSAFRGGWLGKRWVTLFRGVGVGGGGCNFHIKINQNLNYLTPKEVYEQKYISLS